MGWLYGAEYHIRGVQVNLFSGVNNGENSVLYGKPTACAVCYVPRRSTSVMIPARTSCPAGWTQEYTGYLMSEHTYPNRPPTMYICVDGAPEVERGPVLQSGATFVLVKIHCGTLPCSKYHNWEVACVVCTK